MPETLEGPSVADESLSLGEATVYVVDDDDAVRDSVSRLITTLGMKACCFSTAESFLSGYDPSCHSCLLLDIRMPGISGLDLQESLRGQGVQIPIVIISAHGDIPICVRAMQHGALDFLEKPYEPAELRRCIELALDEDARGRRLQAERAITEARLAKLSDEERKVMEGIVDGVPNKEIASTLDLSLRTVQFRRSSMMRKLGVDNRAQLVKLVAAIELQSD